MNHDYSVITKNASGGVTLPKSLLEEMGFGSADAIFLIRDESGSRDGAYRMYPWNPLEAFKALRGGSRVTADPPANAEAGATWTGQEA